MEIHSLFSTPVIVFDIPATAELNAELTRSLVAESEAIPGIQRANCGGWHSVPDIALRQAPVFQAHSGMLLHHVRLAFGRLAASRGYDPVPGYGISLQSWAMVMRDGDYTIHHDHAQSTLSMAYYVDTGDADLERYPSSGNIAFIDPRRGASEVAGLDLFPSTFELRPATGQLVIFPGYLQHYVHPYRGARPRVCVASNVVITLETRRPS